MQSGLIGKIAPRLRGVAERWSGPRSLLSAERWRQRALSLWACRPKSVPHWLSVILVWTVLGVYLVTWVKGNRAYLVDVDWQADDVRTALFPFHRYGPEHALKNDPIALEMLAYIPLFVRAVFWASVPWFGLAAACKVSQSLCLLVIVGGGLALATYRRTGLALGALFVFVFLRDSFVIERIASGLPRGYGFPVLALWSAGALAQRVSIRRVALVLGALTYPTALAMGLAAEGLLVTSGFFGHSRAYMWRTAKRLALTIVLSLVAVIPALTAGSAADGKVHTLEQAKREPAFGKRGRLYVLPFADARDEFGQHFAATFSRQGQSPFPALPAAIKPQSGAIAVALIALVMVISLVGLSPLPRVAIAFFASTSILFCLSCIFAFRLYSPERYYSYGMRAAGILLLLNVVGYAGFRLGNRWRYVVRNVVSAVTMLALWFCLGDGIVARNGITINRKWLAPLYDFVATLPVDVRIASHPSDGDDIPFFAARATLGGYETLQPWLTGSWARQKQRAEDSLVAMYATDPKQVLDYADKYGVTHVLVNTARYRNSDYIKASATFEPLTTFARDLLANIKPSDMVFNDPPKQAIIFSYKTLHLLSMDKLREVWRAKPEP
jgi:hypothetical protein